VSRAEREHQRALWAAEREASRHPGATVLGVSPGGVAWVCYRRGGEADSEFAERLTLMTNRLATVWARHERREAEQSTRPAVS